MRAKPRKPTDPAIIELTAACLAVIREAYDPYSVVGGALAVRRLKKALQDIGQ